MVGKFVPQLKPRLCFCGAFQYLQCNNWVMFCKFETSCLSELRMLGTNELELILRPWN